LVPDYSKLGSENIQNQEYLELWILGLGILGTHIYNDLWASKQVPISIVITHIRLDLSWKDKLVAGSDLHLFRYWSAYSLTTPTFTRVAAMS
jgi:hypothetical protein